MPTLLLNKSYPSYEKIFIDEGYKILHKEGTSVIPDLVLFTGGTDVDSLLYGKKSHQFNGRPDVLRDKQEIELYNYALKNKIPMVGICRGAQLLCVLNGGQLVQHVTDHGVYHEAYLPRENTTIIVSSSHHQMMAPAGTDYEILAYANQRSSTYQTTDGGWKSIHMVYDDIAGRTLDGIIIEPEVVYWKNTKCLGHQPHPEWMQESSMYYQYFFNTIQNYLGVK